MGQSRYRSDADPAAPAFAVAITSATLAAIDTLAQHDSAAQLSQTLSSTELG